MPHSVVLPAPCNPHIMIIVGGLSATSSFALVEPMSAMSSSLTILMTCWAGLRLCKISCPTAFSDTSAMNFLATRILTSASKSAMRTSRIAVLISSSVRRPCFVSFEKMWLSLSERDENNATLFPSLR